MKKNKKQIQSKGFDLLQNDSNQIENLYTEKEELNFDKELRDNQTNEDITQNEKSITDDLDAENDFEIETDKLEQVSEEKNKPEKNEPELDESYFKPEEKIENGVPNIEINNTISKDVLSSTDISSIFEQANNNVLSAKNIFNQNIEMKKKLDAKFVELNQLKEQHEIRKNKIIKK